MIFLGFLAKKPFHKEEKTLICLKNNTQMKQDKLIHSILRIMLFSFMGLAALFTLLFYLDTEARAGMLINYGKILIILGAAAAVIFPIIFIVMNPKNALKIVIVLVGLLALAGLSYAFASGSIEGAVYEKFEVTASSSKMVGGALILTYVLAGLAVLAIVYSSISKMFK